MTDVFCAIASTAGATFCGPAHNSAMPPRTDRGGGEFGVNFADAEKAAENRFVRFSTI